MKPLTYHIKDIEAAKSKGLDIQHTLDQATLLVYLADAITDSGADPQRSAASLRANLAIHSADTVHARGRLSGHLTLKCQRCLEDAVAPVDAELNLTFVPYNSRAASLADPFLGAAKVYQAPKDAKPASKDPKPAPKDGRRGPRPGQAAGPAGSPGMAKTLKDIKVPKLVRDGKLKEAPAIAIDPNDPDDIDYAHHDREVVDLGDIVREYLLLSVPITVLCREDCQGLCPSCGADLNKTACGCEQGVSLSPFAALKKLELNRS